MKKKMMSLLVLLFFGIGIASAQTLSVKGVVISEEDGQPVIGASVLVKGTAFGTVTNADGAFALSGVPSTAKFLQVSYIGMITQEVAIQTDLRIVLKTNSHVLDEVVISTGYGTVKKHSFTGSASTVATQKLEDVPTLGLQGKLAGAVPGLQVTATSGQPGAAPSLRIRGMGSINAGNEPLYVIDGIPMNSGNVAGFGYSDAGNSLLATLNSNDIETITVIKDAAAASLYGSRAANGVIVITTKQGKIGKTQFSAK
ncbi:MAG: TonB-dependent receptor plug domain-containing protein, partial [Mediterranea sp.]|nr:TonB-dependent receptor plug domain-containing protein [Mediterranea sp.]